jgi:uncharacterized protein (DUF1800 family)
MASSTIAANRFGYGLKRDERIGSAPKDWLQGQLRRYRPRVPAFDGLATRADVAKQLANFIETARDMREAQTEDSKADKMVARRETAQMGRQHYAQAVSARFSAALESDTPFAERLVHFWANHFAVSADKFGVVAFSGLLEVEAIRPHLMGRFSDMVLAVEQHPAMLLYLDQVQSVGPNSPLGARLKDRGAKQGGLNENLAREILELHTLGVRTVYTQADVTEFARALTGWTVAGIARGPIARQIGGEASPGEFVFAPAVHEPGARTIIGKTYPAAGEAQARAILSDLARNPATARQIATKLARHFQRDEPSPMLVARLERRFLETGGSLPDVYAALIEAPEVWAEGSTKFKTPWDWMVSAYRALQIPEPEARVVANVLNELGQPVWRPKSPAGYDDVATSWAGPDALYRRVEVAERLAARSRVTDPSALARQLFDDTISASTLAAIGRAESPQQGLALLLVSPEFLRR